MLILSCILLGLNVVSDALNSEANRRIRDLSSKLTKYYQSHQDEYDKLVKAYQDHDSMKVNTLLTTSPIGNSYRHLKKNLASYRNKKQEEIDNKKKQIDDVQDLQEQTMNTSMSPTSGLIIGEANKLGATAALETKADELINGGIDNAKK